MHCRASSESFPSFQQTILLSNQTNPPIRLSHLHLLIKKLLVILFRLVKVRRVLHGRKVSKGTLGLDESFRNLALLVRVSKDCRTVLCTCPCRISRRMKRKVHVQQLLVAYFFRIEMNANGFCVCGLMERAKGRQDHEKHAMNQTKKWHSWHVRTILNILVGGILGVGIL